MKKMDTLPTLYILSTCSTCQRLLKQVKHLSLQVRDIKVAPLQEHELRQLAALAGGYAQLFSRRAQKYRALGLHLRALDEEEMRAHMLREYTFIKRPLLAWTEGLLAGSAARIAQHLGVSPR